MDDVAEQLPPVLTAVEIAKLERLDISTVFYWLRGGKLRGYKAGGAWRVPSETYLDFRKWNARVKPRTRARSPAAARTGWDRDADRFFFDGTGI
jgi:hypothetical protein